MAVILKTGKHFNGIRAGVQFKDGVGVFEDEAKGMQVAELLGYEVMNEAGEKPATKPDKKKATKKAGAL